jgi:hypothetical protein
MNGLRQQSLKQTHPHKRGKSDHESTLNKIRTDPVLQSGHDVDELECLNEVENQTYIIHDDSCGAEAMIEGHHKTFD